MKNTRSSKPRKSSGGIRGEGILCSDLAAKAARGVAESESRGMDCGWSRDGGGEQGPADAAEDTHGREYG